MNEAWFSRPVPVSVGIIGDIHNVLNAKQALDLLIHHWPDVGSESYRDARRACLEVVNGPGKESEKARAAFVEAARSARILIE